MRRQLASLLVISLLGCGTPTVTEDNHGYGWAYDAQGPSGLQVRYAASMAADRRPPIEWFEGIYIDVSACVGVTTTGPLLILVDDLIGSTVLQGRYLPDTRTAVVWTDTRALHNSTTQMRLPALKHEFVHHVLYAAGVPPEIHDTHAHLAFDACSGHVAWP